MLRTFELLTPIASGLFLALVEAAVPVYAAADMAAMEIVTERARISPNEVTLQNLEAFQAQMRDDLPVGTPKGKVEAYLVQLRIRHLFLEPVPIYSEYGNSFQGLVENIGMLGGLQASLSFWVRLDEAGAVKDILFRVKYL